MTTAPQTLTTAPPAPATTGRRLSLLTPSGRLTIGNHLGALRGMLAAQGHGDCFYGVSDLHAMTTRHDPAALRRATRELQLLLLAAGLDPSRVTLFRQSHVPSHTELAYLLECTAHLGELGRMVQFKQKRRSGDGAVSATRASLLTYPVLMAADILLYRPSEVPVGEDQRQHVELARDLAVRFNRTYGEVFTVPLLTLPAAGARVMDLQEPRRKMSKSDATGAGVVFLLDPPDVVRRKIARAVTDSDTGPAAVRHAPASKPGVSNLLELLAACTGTTPAEAAEGVSTYARLKQDVTDAVLAHLEPLQRRYAELAGDPGYVDAVYAQGAQRCRTETAAVLAAARTAIGLD
jgi:tryptophanyl-tRNA synthetase